MPYMQTMDRNQMMMCTMDSFVDQESIVRVIDIFVESLDLDEMEFARTEAANEGRPLYPPKGLLKLYIYGNRKGIRSSRKLAEECRINVEARWLMEGLEPDHRTISDFRKENIGSMKKVFHEFNSRLFEVLVSGFVSVDGSKFQACCAKDRNFTAGKLDDRIKWLNQHVEEYLRQLDEADQMEGEQEELAGRFTLEELETKLAEARERLERYEGYREYMEKNGLSQLSITDPDSKLMKNKNGFAVSYNVQTTVDSETHLIRDYKITNQPTDHGLIEPAVHDIKEESPQEVLEAVADKGYMQEEDMVECLENGVIPHVILPDGQDVYELETAYEAAEIDEETKNSRKADDIRKCMKSGEIPEAYAEVIEKAEVVEKREFIKDDANEAEEKETPYGSEEEMAERAAQGYYVRDPERNMVICPAGEILRQKSIKKNGNIRYANKTACRNCPHRDKCYKGKAEWKEIDFNKDTLEKPCKPWLEAEGREDDSIKQKKQGHYETKKVVKLTFRPDRQKMDQRKCLSEHPFGTVKRWMNAGYYLLKGIQKTDGETAIIFLGYNLARAINLLGFRKMMKIMA